MAGNDLHQVKSNINVTPLIDVLLVLLVIFMMVTPLLVQALPSELPKKSDRPIPEQYAERQLVLTITSDRRYLLNREEIGMFEVEPRIREAFAKRGGIKTIFVGADDSLVYAEVVRAIDTCLAAGAEKVGIVTDSLALPQPGG